MRVNGLEGSEMDGMRELGAGANLRYSQPNWVGNGRVDNKQCH